MRLGPKIITAVSLVLAAFACWLTASTTADIIEKRSGQAVEIALIEAGHDWTDVYTDGLQVHVGGMAPTEARRFNALHVAGTVVESTRIVDGTTIIPTEPLSPPKFSIEILRNDEGVTLIGLVPDTTDRAAMINEITSLAEGSEVIDLLQTATYPVPSDWEESVHFGLNALARLSRSKISISAGAVKIDAISSSAEEKRTMEQTLTRRVPKGVELTYNVTAPRPVITPFTLRFLIDEGGPSFDACSVDTTRGRDRILKAARDAGMIGPANCTLGLGIPSPEWTNAVIQGIAAIKELGGGSVTFSDADVTLVALDSTPLSAFDRAVGELESNLPEVFSLHSVRPEPVVVDGTGEGESAGPPEFVATRSPEGQVQLRGRLNNQVVRNTVESYAKARFGVNAIYTAARIDENLPEQWPIRVLASLEALSELESGVAIVQEGYIEVRGKSGHPDAQAEIARIFSEKLGESQNYKLDVTYDEALDPIAALPTPDECVGQINDLLAKSKITFEPGSTDLAGEAVPIVNNIADILKACRDVDMEIEIAGHTDSQGREEMNLELSHSRAEAVLDALVARRVLTSQIKAQGYGEIEPIADNDTEEGREDNRRIEFRLIGDTPEDVTAEAENGEQAESDDPSDTTAEATEEAPVEADDTAGSEDTKADAEPEASPEAEPANQDAAPPEGEAEPLEELDATTGAAETTTDTPKDAPADAGTEDSQ